jgi:hypothetical protein
MMLLLAACAGHSDDSTAFVAGECADTWPDDTCGADGCDADPVGSRWEDTFVRGFSEATGEPEDVVAEHVRIRRMEPAPSLTAKTGVDYQVDIDWVRFVEHVEVWAAGPAGTADVTGPDALTDDDLVASWKNRLAIHSLDLRQRLVSLEDAQAFVEECAADQDVEFPDSGWCSASLSTFQLAFYADDPPASGMALLALDDSDAFSCGAIPAPVD